MFSLLRVCANRIQPYTLRLSDWRNTFRTPDIQYRDK